MHSTADLVLSHSLVRFFRAGSSGKQMSTTLPGSLGRAGPVLQSALQDHQGSSIKGTDSPRSAAPQDASPNTLFRQVGVYALAWKSVGQAS